MPDSYYWICLYPRSPDHNTFFADNKHYLRFEIVHGSPASASKYFFHNSLVPLIESGGKGIRKHLGKKRLQLETEKRGSRGHGGQFQLELILRYSTAGAGAFHKAPMLSEASHNSGANGSLSFGSHKIY